MDNLFLIRTLTAAVNAMKSPSMRIYNRFFAPKENFVPSDRLAFDIISGSEKVLKNLSIYAPAETTDKTGRKTVTLTAPRLAHKRFIHTAEMNSIRAYGGQVATELMKDRIAREQKDMLNMVDRTKEFWAANALKGKIYDSDMSSVLVDYNLDTTHLVTLSGTSLWTNANSDPLAKMRAFKKTIETDSNAPITGWFAYVGSEVMDALLAHASIKDFIKYNNGSKIAADGSIARLAGIDLEEYNASFLDVKGGRQYFIEAKYMLLIGICEDLLDCPFAPVVDSEAPSGVGNVAANGQGVPFFSKAWDEKDPSGKWIKVESRPLPVLQRPGAVIYAKVV